MDGKSTAKAKVVIGGPSMALAAQGSAVALQTAAPDAASASAVLAANPNIATGFGAAPTFFAIDELGGAYASGGTTAETITSTASLTVDLTQLASLQDLEVGFFDPTVVGSGFTSLTFTLTGDGHTLISQTFTTVAAADAFFADRAVDLGSLATGQLSGGPLTLVAKLTLTTDAPGSGYYLQMIAGDPPPDHASSIRFAHAMAGLSRDIAGSALPPGGGASRPQPMLAVSRMAAMA